MDDQKRLDEELAELTDALMEGRDMKPSTEAEALDQTIRLLNEVIRPDGRPDMAFRARLTQRLNEEWAMAHPRKIRRYNQPIYRFAAAAAVLIFGLLGVLLLTKPETTAPPNPQGTVFNLPPGPVIVASVVVLGGIAFYLWRRRR